MLTIPDLTNPGAQEASIVLQTHLTAGEKVRDGRNRLSVIACTGTDRQNEVTER